jgi:hypothetical protein
VATHGPLVRDARQRLGGCVDLVTTDSVAFDVSLDSGPGWHRVSLDSLLARVTDGLNRDAGSVDELTVHR